MGKTSRDKGKRGERELAAALKGHGYECRRGQQYNGADGSADVVGLPGVHIECKRVEKLNLYDAMAQAIADAQSGEFPAVFSRRNHCDWLVTMRLDDWVQLYREAQLFMDTRATLDGAEPVTIPPEVSAAIQQAMDMSIEA